MPKTKQRPHRHSEGVHIEQELRYLRPAGFSVPDILGGLRHTDTVSNPHVDRYYDARGEDGPRLRAADCSLRVRVKASGDVLATFKRKRPDAGARSLREETEDAIVGERDPSSDYVGLVANGASEALGLARTLAGDAPLVHLFTITNERTDHHYREGNSHVVLSEDSITYPDGSHEQRVEVEHVAGDPELLDRIDAQLAQRYPGLKVCKRGKLSEGRRRLRDLLS